MDKLANLQLSENLLAMRAGDYFVTAAIWRVQIEHEVFDSFEIGIREIKTGQFHLLQNRRWQKPDVLSVANAIAILLSDKTYGFGPEWCRDKFCE